MRIAIVADVHGNLTALEAVLEEIEREGFDLVVSAGDVVSGPQPRECLHRLSALGDRVRWVMGNADREEVEFFDARTPGFVADRLDRADRDLLAAFAPTVSAGDGAVLVCHGTPDSDTAIVTTRTAPDALAAIVAGVAEPLVVGGHVHMQFRTDRWINAGSVGMPYQGEPGAFWLALTPEGPDLRRTVYDLAAAERAIRATGYPAADDVVAAITGAVSRTDALDAFDPLS